jgi:teichuronic acid exporter
LLKAFRMAQRAVMCVNMPAMIGLALVSKPFVAVVYGNQWLNAAPILSILAIPASYFPMQVLNLSLLSSYGDGRSYLALEIVKKSIGIAIIVFAAYYGVMAVAKGALTTSVITLIFNTFLTHRKIGFGLFKQWRELLPTVFSCLCMALVLYFYQREVRLHHPLFDLLSSVLIGSITYALASLVLQRKYLSEMYMLFFKRKAA